MIAKIINSKFLFLLFTIISVQFVVNSGVIFAQSINMSSMILFSIVTFVSVVLSRLFWKEGGSFEFFNVVDHELTHSIFALIFQRKVIELYANSNGTGHTMYGSDTSALSARLTSLAPYLISVGTVLLLIIQFVGASAFLVPFTVLGAIFTGYRGISLFKDARPHQSDFARTGYSWAIILVIASFILLILIELSYANGGTKTVLTLIKESGKSTYLQLSFLAEKSIEYIKLVWKIVTNWGEFKLIPWCSALFSQIVSDIQRWR